MGFVESRVVLNRVRIEYHHVGEGPGLEPAAIRERQVIRGQRGELAHRRGKVKRVICAYVLRQHPGEVAIGARMRRR